jgi:hypothetical protein
MCIPFHIKQIGTILKARFASDETGDNAFLKIQPANHTPIDQANLNRLQQPAARLPGKNEIVRHIWIIGELISYTKYFELVSIY